MVEMEKFLNETSDAVDRFVEKRMFGELGEAAKRKLTGDKSVSLVIPIPPEVEPYADDIRRFVHAMIYKLKVHHKKGRWEGKTMEEYLPLLQGEVDELGEAVQGGNLIEILTEAADTANMAMIVASIATERGK